VSYDRHNLRRIYDTRRWRYRIKKKNPTERGFDVDGAIKFGGRLKSHRHQNPICRARALSGPVKILFRALLARAAATMVVRFSVFHLRTLMHERANLSGSIKRARAAIRADSLISKRQDATASESYLIARHSMTRTEA